MDSHQTPNYAVRNTEMAARQMARHDALELRVISIDESKDPFENVKSWEAFAESLPVVWLPAEENPMLRPAGGIYSSGEPYTKEKDPMYGNFDGMAHVVLKDTEGKVLEYIGFEVPAKCLRCLNLNFCKPVLTSRRAPFCKVDGRPCGKRIVDGCEDFKDSSENEDSTKRQ